MPPFSPTTFHEDPEFVTRTLNDFGNVTSYDWWPPYHECELASMAGSTFIHPVLTGQRFANSVLRYKRYGSAESWFTTDSWVRRRLDLEEPSNFLPELVEAIRKDANWGALLALRQAARDSEWTDTNLQIDDLIRKSTDVLASENLAIGGRTYQSSTSRWSQHPDPRIDSARAVNGSFGNTQTFHTNLEINPWWAIDLKAICAIRQIKLYNRLSEARRARSISIWASISGRDWAKLFHHPASDGIWGDDGVPLCVSIQPSEIARFVRVELNGVDYLHLEQVEIYGAPLPSSSSAS
jgi:hypothetical protein